MAAFMVWHGRRQGRVIIGWFWGRTARGSGDRDRNICPVFAPCVLLMENDSVARPCGCLSFYVQSFSFEAEKTTNESIENDKPGSGRPFRVSAISNGPCPKCNNSRQQAQHTQAREKSESQPDLVILYATCIYGMMWCAAVCPPCYYSTLVILLTHMVCGMGWLAGLPTIKPSHSFPSHLSCPC